MNSILKLILPLLFANILNTSAQTKEFVWREAQWITNDMNAKVVSDSILTMKKGICWLKDVDIENGIVEVDTKATRDRSFSGIIFHLDEENMHYNEVYYRNHKSGFPDALQYTPVFYEFNNWQLYPEHQKAIQLKKSGWNHLKIEVINGTMKVYVNDNKEPSMEVLQLKQLEK
jgi:hypothetical protein